MQENTTAKTPSEKARLLLTLFLTFLKIGACTFGGGYAMIPLIQRDIAKKHKWITDDDILEIVAISESTPGPIAINAATFVGYRIGGFFGAFLSTFGVVLPSFVINTSCLQEQIKEKKEADPELKYHGDNEEFLKNIEEEIRVITGD